MKTILYKGDRDIPAVAEYLKQKGYIILKRNWRDRYGEVDIIAESKTELVFVEVKTRSENAVVTGLEAIDSGKISRIRREAEMFSKRLNSDLPYRIDVADVTYFAGEDGKYKWKLNYIKSAF
jgi:putative endonuclease